MQVRKWNLVVVGIAALAGSGSALPALAEGGKQVGRQIDREIKMVDTNGDMKLTAEEHTNGVQAMFAKMDADKDGKVTAQEMDAAHEQVTGSRARKSEMSGAEKIAVIDSNGDGALTEEEHIEGARRMFQRMDTDQDGLITRREIMAGHKKMLQYKASQDEPAAN